MRIQSQNIKNLCTLIILVIKYHPFILCLLNVFFFFQKWTIHRGIRRKSGSPPRTTQNSDESGSQVSGDS